MTLRVRARKALTPFFGVRASGTTPAVDKVVAAAAADAKRLKMIKNSLSPHAGGYQKPKKHKKRGKGGKGHKGGRSAKDNPAKAEGSSSSSDDETVRFGRAPNQVKGGGAGPAAARS